MVIGNGYLFLLCFQGEGPGSYLHIVSRLGQNRVLGIEQCEGCTHAGSRSVSLGCCHGCCGELGLVMGLDDHIVSGIQHSAVLDPNTALASCHHNGHGTCHGGIAAGSASHSQCTVHALILIIDILLQICADMDAGNCFRFFFGILFGSLRLLCHDLAGKLCLCGVGIDGDRHTHADGVSIAAVHNGSTRSIGCKIADVFGNCFKIRCSQVIYLNQGIIIGNCHTNRGGNIDGIGLFGAGCLVAAGEGIAHTGTGLIVRGAAQLVHDILSLIAGLVSAFGLCVLGAQCVYGYGKDLTGLTLVFAALLVHSFGDLLAGIGSVLFVGLAVGATVIPALVLIFFKLLELVDLIHILLFVSTHCHGKGIDAVRILGFCGNGSQALYSAAA